MSNVVVQGQEEIQVYMEDGYVIIECENQVNGYRRIPIAANNVVFVCRALMDAREKIEGLGSEVKT